MAPPSVKLVKWVTGLLGKTKRVTGLGDVVGVIGIAQDMSSVKQKEQDIRRLLDDAQRLIETVRRGRAPENLASLDPDGLRW